MVDEILVNARDARVRTGRTSRAGVELNRATGEISVWNDGDPIPVRFDAERGLWDPELIFGELRSGESFNDSEERLYGGRNGLGAKLTNIYSRWFRVEVVDAKRHKKYSQTWRENMTKKEPAIVEKSEAKESRVRVSFLPDYARFGLPGLDADTHALLSRRAFDLAATTPGLRVRLDGRRVPVRSLKE